MPTILMLLACSREFGSFDSGVEELPAPTHEASMAFTRDLDGFIARLPEHGMVGRFDDQGAQLDHDGEGLAVRTRSWGRGRELTALAARAPEPERCVPRTAPDCVGRLEYLQPDFVEWWTTAPGGFEQGWTVNTAPPGEGPLQLVVGIEGAQATVGDDEVWLAGSGGGRWLVRGLTAHDADGAPLSARFEPHAEGFLVVVDDAGARYPLEIDPVYATATTTWTGESTSDYFGYSVAVAGDINGDGYDDVVAGAWRYGSGVGRAYVYEGSAIGMSSAASTTLNGSGTSSFGYSVAGAGDVNRDGYDDVVVGAFGYSSHRGRVYVYLGSATGLSTSAVTTLTGTGTDSFGYSVAGAGDVNGDGYDDIIVGEYGYSSWIGRAYVYHGSSSGVSATATTTLTGATSGDRFGDAVAGAGDVNGDGYDDVLVGAYRSTSSTGSAYVYHGSRSGISSAAAATLGGASTGDSFGESLAGVGDVNGDGYDDIIVGAEGAGSTGESYIFEGSSSGVAATATTLPTGGGTFAQVAGAGDVNADGFADVMISTPSDRLVEIYEGSSSGVSSTASSVLYGASTTLAFGAGLGGRGDLNGDGYDDVVVGDPYASTYTGRAYVYLDCLGTDEDADGYSIGTDCDDGNAAVNPAAVEVCDVVDNDCDGSIDEGFAYGTWYTDSDGDGFGDDASAEYTCAPSLGAITTGGDCDDGDAAVNAASTEVCDSADTDEDCDGVADNDDTSAAAAGKTTFYRDADGDRYGSTTTGAYCDLPAGYAALGTDCDDGDAGDYPGARETVANGDDEDCDGVDSCYTDDDGDNFGTTVVIAGSSLSCTTGTGAPVSTDCDDADRSAYPGATEVPDDAVDEDCDGFESCPADADADGYAADGGVTVVSRDLDCRDAGEATTTTPATDCDDAESTVNPGATEIVADGTDQDCDDRELCYDDDDGDGSVDTSGDTRPSGDLDCNDANEAGSAASTTDCDDGSSTVHVGATEVVGDGIDQDCDSRELCYDDADDDGFLDGAGETFESRDADCEDAGEGTAADPSTDCDDARDDVYPGAAESVGDGVDGDCDGRERCFADADEDGYADAGGETVASTALDCSASGMADLSTPATDCDDDSADVNPSADEIVSDGVDQDCDDVDLCQEDTDRDGYGTTVVRAGDDLDCDDGSSAVSGRSDDCDDANASAHPAATEVVGDGVDQDCDGREICYTDADGDGLIGPEGDTVASADGDCTDAGEAGDGAPMTDCDDGDASAGEQFWYVDADDDAYGDDRTRAAMCDPGDGFVRVGGDCVDDDASIFPGTDSYDRVCGSPSEAACGCAASTSAGDGLWPLAAVAGAIVLSTRRRAGTSAPAPVRTRAG